MGIWKKFTHGISSLGKRKTWRPVGNFFKATYSSGIKPAFKAGVNAVKWSASSGKELLKDFSPAGIIDSLGNAGPSVTLPLALGAVGLGLVFMISRRG